MPINFKLVSDFTMIQRRSFELVDPEILKPANANPLLDGEWLQMHATNHKMQRGSGDAGADTPSWVWFAEQGRYETQAIKKGPILYLGEFEADTKIFDGTGLTTAGQPLMVADVTIGGLTRRGLKLRTGTNHIVARVVRLSANNGGFLRFITTRN
jgi:hypothetical protein